MAEPLISGLDPRKKLYSALVGGSDKELANQVKQFSYNKFNTLLDNNDFVQDLFMDISERGIILDPKNPGASKDPVEFANAFIYKAPPAPKQQAAPKQEFLEVPSLEEQEAYIPPPQPAVGSPEYDKQLQRQYGGMSPTLGATFAGAPASFETEEQKKQEQISPVFKAQKLAFEDVPIAEEQRESQRQFAKATKEQQKAALRGGAGFELEQEKRRKERGDVEWGGDVVGSWAEGGKRIAKNILSTIGYFAQTQAATDPMANLPYEKRQEMVEQAGQKMYENATSAQNTFQDEIAKRNIQTSVLQAINKGEYSKLPESVLYTVGDAAMQVIPSFLTFGGSTYMQTLPQVYKDGVDAIAKEKGVSPEQVVASGDDAFVVSQINAGLQSALEYMGAGLISKSIASRGAYKAIRDYLLKQNINRNLARGASLLGVSAGEAFTEYGQEGVGQIGTTAAKSPTVKAFFDKLPNELFTPEARNQREEALVGGFVGGLGLAGAGQTFQSAMDRTLFEAPKIGKATQRPDMDVVQLDNKIQERNKIVQAMEEAVKANPEAEGQIRQQYQKRINEAAPADNEVLMAYESLTLLPETDEKNSIRENLEAYMAEKGIAPQAEAVTAEEVQGTGRRIVVDSIEEVPAEYRDKVFEVTAGPLGRFGIGKKQYAYIVPTETVDVTAPEITTEEDLAEDIPFEDLTDEESIVDETSQEDEDLASLVQDIDSIEQDPAEEEVVTEETVTIAPLNIDFAQNEGRNVNYQGIEGRIKIDSDGAPYVFTKDGDVIYIEGGLSGQTPQQLGVQPLADDVINEADIETVLEDETAPLDQNELQYDFDNNTITLYGKPFTYEGVETNSKGQTTALRLRDANGKVKFVRNEDTILEFEIQKELYEKSRTNKQPTIESATAAAEQLQVVPITRVEQVSEPVQQEGSTSNLEGDEVAAPTTPAPKGRKKAAPVKPAPAVAETKFKPNPNATYYISKGADEVFYTLREIAGDDLDVHVMNLSKDLADSKQKAKELIGEDVEFDETSLGRDYNKIKANKTGKGKQLAQRKEGEGVAGTLSFGKYNGKTIDEIFEIDKPYILYLNKEYPTNTVFQKGVRDNPKIKEFIEQSLADKEQQRKNLENLTEIGGVKFDDKGVAKTIPIKGKIKYINNRMGPQGMYKVYILDTEYGIPVEVSGDIAKFADGNLEQGAELSFTANVQKSGDKFKVIGRKSEYTKPEPKKETPKPKPKKEETPTETKPSSTTPQEGDTVEIAPQREGGSPRKMVFKGGEWKQNVGGEVTIVGASVQQQAQEAFAGKAEVKPAETKAETGSVVGGEATKGFTAKDGNKVVDEKGEPIVVYHGTTKGGFVNFSPEGAIKSGNRGGIFFTDNRNVAQAYEGSGSDIEIKGEYFDKDAELEKLNEQFGNNQEYKDENPIDGLNRAYRNLTDSRSSDLEKKLGYDSIKKITGSKKLADEYIATRKILSERESNTSAGIYSARINIQNPLVVDFKGKEWNDGIFEGKKVSTNDLTIIALKRGNDGVIIKNVVDIGAAGKVKFKTKAEKVANVYVVFDKKNIELITSEQSVKSQLATEAKAEAEFTSQKSSNLAAQVEDMRSLPPAKRKATQQALEEEYGKEEVAKMIEITANFTKIIEDLEQKQEVKKDCP